MVFSFVLPEIGEGVVEGEIVQWLLKQGDTVQIDQPFVEVMTDKATVVIPSPVAGLVQELRAAEGDIVAIGQQIAVVESEAAAVPVAKEAAPPPEVVTPNPVSPPPPPPAPPPKPAPVSMPAERAKKVLAAPATRRLARSLGIDLSTLTGSGKGGRITAEDVEKAAHAPDKLAPPTAVETTRQLTPPTLPPPDLATGDEVLPVRGLRRRIWESMTRSAFTAAHFTYVEECDCTELVALRERYKAHLLDGEPRLNYLPFVIKAAVATLKRVPRLNGHVDDKNRAFIQRSDINIGIAVASGGGLTVPVVRNADRLSILELSAEIFRLAHAVRSGEITTADLGDSTFTITSLGKDGGLMATPIINYPEVAIMGVHKMVKRPMVMEDDSIAVRHMMNFSLSFDHRLIDGQVGAEFTNAVIRRLENPDRLMMES